MMYLVMRLMREVDVSVGGITQTLAFTQMSDGMEGVLPVFATLEEAEPWCENGKYKVLPIEIGTGDGEETTESGDRREREGTSGQGKKARNSNRKTQKAKGSGTAANGTARARRKRRVVETPVRRTKH